MQCIETYMQCVSVKEVVTELCRLSVPLRVLASDLLMMKILHWITDR